MPMPYKRPEPLDAPTLTVSDNRVARALDHLQALRKIYSEMREMELAKIRTGEIKVIKLPKRVYEQRRHTSSIADLLMK